MDMPPIDESHPFIRQLIDQNIRNTATIDLLNERYHAMALDVQKIPTLVATTETLLAKIRELETDQIVERSHNKGMKSAFDVIHKWLGWLAATTVVVSGLIFARATGQ